MAEPVSDPLLRGVTTASNLLTAGQQRETYRQLAEAQRYKAYLDQQKLLAEQQAMEQQRQLSMQLASVFDSEDFRRDPRSVVPKVMALTSALGQPKIGAELTDNIYKLYDAHNLQLVARVHDAFTSRNLNELANAYAEYYSRTDRGNWQAIARPTNKGIVIELVSDKTDEKGNPIRRAALLDEPALQHMMQVALNRAGHDPSKIAQGYRDVKTLPFDIAKTQSETAENRANVINLQAQAAKGTAEARLLDARTHRENVGAELDRLEAARKNMDVSQEIREKIMKSAMNITDTMVPKADSLDPQAASQRQEVANIATAFSTLAFMIPDNRILQDPAAITRQFYADTRSDNEERRSRWKILMYSQKLPGTNQEVPAGAYFVIPGGGKDTTIPITTDLAYMLSSLLNIKFQQDIPYPNLLPNNESRPESNDLSNLSGTNPNNGQPPEAVLRDLNKSLGFGERPY